MPATALKIGCLWLALGATAASDDAVISQLLYKLKAALEAGSAAGFLAHVDRRMPGYAVLENNVVALLAQNEVGASIDILEQARDGSAFEVTADWLLQLKPLSGAGAAERRRGTVWCRIEKQGNNWKVTALEPAAFFRPAGAPER